MVTYNSVQVLRGLAALLVVFHHFMQIFYNFERTNVIGDFFSDFGGRGVDIFFVISGFIMTHIVISKDKTAYSFILDRLIRVVPNYWFYSFVVVFIGWFIVIHSTDVTFYSFFQSLFFIPHENPNPRLGIFPTLSVGWTLNYEMFFYVVVSLFLLVFGKNINAIFLYTAIILLFIPILNLFFTFGYYRYYLIEFILGVGIYYLIKINKEKLTLGILAFSFVLFLLSFHHIFDKMLMSFFIVLLFVIFENKFKYDNIFINTGLFLGNISYSIYLSHSLVMYVLYDFFIGFGWDKNSYLEVSVFFALTMFFTILISYISYHLIELNFSHVLKNRVRKLFLKL